MRGLKIGNSDLTTTPFVEPVSRKARRVFHAAAQAAPVASWDRKVSRVRAMTYGTSRSPAILKAVPAAVVLRNFHGGPRILLVWVVVLKLPHDPRRRWPCAVADLQTRRPRFVLAMCRGQQLGYCSVAPRAVSRCQGHQRPKTLAHSLCLGSQALRKNTPAKMIISGLSAVSTGCVMLSPATGGGACAVSSTISGCSRTP
jgi:hypothetical protein